MDILQAFADSSGVPRDEIAARWDGRPDRIMEDLFRAPDEDGVLHPLRLFGPYQPQFVQAYFYGDASTITLLKGRRIGGSYVALLCLVLEGIMKPGMFYPLVSTKEDQAHSRINDIRNILKHAVIDIPTPTDNKGVIELWNGTEFKAYTGSAGGARGDGARSILFDEMDFMEDQDEMLRAFKPMMSLSTGKLIQVSTANSTNDAFMRSFNRGSPSGFDPETGKKLGVISLFQPTFMNADEIDVEVSLYDQHVVPARPDLNIDVVESERAEDPMGFSQEYLCIPAAEQYRFYDPASVTRAMKRSTDPQYRHGEFVGPQRGGMMVMGVDVGIEHDYTVASVFEHVGDQRFQRHHEPIREDGLLRSGIEDPDRGNANHIAQRLADIYHQTGCEYLIIDKTGAGATFPRLLERLIGKGVVGFNFSDTKAVHKMMGELNAGLRNDRVTLINDEQLKDHLVSIERRQSNDQAVPRFSGKDQSADGMDDCAIAAALGAFPPGFESPVTTDVAYKDANQPSKPRDDLVVRPERIDVPGGFVTKPDTSDAPTGVFAASQLKRTPTARRSYRSRYARR